VLLMCRAAGRMQETVNGIFCELARSVNADVPAVVRSVIARVGEEYPDVVIGSSCPVGLPRAFAPAGELANILENLLRNGARAACENATVRTPEMKVGCEAYRGLMTIRVWDSGAGIPAEQRVTLFESRHAGPESRGRGLPYARRRLSQLDGRIEIGPYVPGAGTQLVVTLRSVPVPTRVSAEPREASVAVYGEDALHELASSTDHR